jgi:hypothetical protein
MICRRRKGRDGSRSKAEKPRLSGEKPRHDHFAEND